MTSVNQDIGSSSDPFYSGDTMEITVTVTNSAGAAVDCSSVTIVYGLDTAPHSGGTPLISKASGAGDFTIGGGSNNEIAFTLDPADTEDLDGTYYHEMEITNAAGDVATVLEGTVEIVGDMT